jgi:hypothetical protein
VHDLFSPLLSFQRSVAFAVVRKTSFVRNVPIGIKRCGRSSRTEGKDAVMFLAGLKFALGLIAGGFLLTGMLALAIGGAELFAYWRKKRPHRLWRAKTHAQRRAMPRFRERAFFQFSYRSDDWLPAPSKTESLQ